MMMDHLPVRSLLTIVVLFSVPLMHSCSHGFREGSGELSRDSGTTDTLPPSRPIDDEDAGSTFGFPAAKTFYDEIPDDRSDATAPSKSEAAKFGDEGATSAASPATRESGDGGVQSNRARPPMAKSKGEKKPPRLRQTHLPNQSQKPRALDVPAQKTRAASSAPAAALREAEPPADVAPEGGGDAADVIRFAEPAADEKSRGDIQKLDMQTRMASPIDCDDLNDYFSQLALADGADLKKGRWKEVVEWHGISADKERSYFLILRATAKTEVVPETAASQDQKMLGAERGICRFHGQELDVTLRAW